MMDTTKNRRGKVKQALMRSGRDEQTAERVASKCEAFMFRDHDYGAVSLWATNDGIFEKEHGCADRDLVHETLERYASPRRTLGVAETLWRVREDVHPISVLATVARAMAERGYGADPLGERACLKVSVEEARHPDLPVAGRDPLIHEAIEQGVRQHLGMVVAALRESGPASVPTLRFFERPNASSAGGRRPPFAVARFFCESNSRTRARVLEALDPWRAYLVKCSVHEGAVEVGIALPAEVCEQYLASALPIFSEAITGARIVEFNLAHPLSESERRDLEERCRACTGAVSLQVEGTKVIAQVPSGFVGHYMSDAPLQARISWLNEALAPWGAEIMDVGELQEVRQPQPARGRIQEKSNAYSDALYRRLDRALYTPNNLTRSGADPSPSTKLSGREQAELMDLYQNWERFAPEDLEVLAAYADRVLRRIGEAVNECADHGQDMASYRRQVSEMYFDLPPGPQSLLKRLSAMPKSFFDTPQGKDVKKKAVELVKKEEGADIAKKFEERLDLLAATALESVTKQGAKDKTKESDDEEQGVYARAMELRGIVKAGGTPVSEATLKPGTFNLSLANGGSLKGTGWVTADGVFGVEKTDPNKLLHQKPGWYLNHIPTGAGMGGFASEQIVSDVIDELYAISGADWASYTDPRKIPKDVGAAAARLVRPKLAPNVGHPKRKIPKDVAAAARFARPKLAQFLKAAMKNIRDHVKYDLTEWRQGVNNFYSHMYHPPHAGTGEASFLSHPAPANYGFKAGDPTAISGLKKKLTKQLKMKVKARVQGAKTYAVTVSWGEPTWDGDSIRVPYSWVRN
jgi:hypothetical protein